MSHVDSKDEEKARILPEENPRKHQTNDSEESKKDGIDWEENTEEDPDIEW